MRALPLMLLAILATPAGAAVPYDNYPICMRIYDPGDYTDCRYSTLAQCNANASGLAAQCIVNPYFVGTPQPRTARHHSR